MAKRTTKRKTAKARKAVKAKKVARKTWIFQPKAVLRQPIAALENGVSSLIGYFK